MRAIANIAPARLWAAMAIDISAILLAAGAGMLGGAMNALAGGGTFATLPALIALGLPANMANATSNIALLPGAAASAWSYRRELGPIGGLSVKLIVALTFVFGMVGSLLLVLTPTTTFDFLIPWLLLFAFMIMLFGKQAADLLHARVTIGRSTLITTQCAIGIYGGYFGGGAGLILTAVYGLLANIHPRELFAIRVTMLGAANFAAAFVFIWFGMIKWWACVPMVVGSIAGGWLGAAFGKRISPQVVRLWTLLVTAVTTVVFFIRAYG